MSKVLKVPKVLGRQVLEIKALRVLKGSRASGFSLTTPQADTPCLWVPQHNTISAPMFQGGRRSISGLN